MESSSESDSEVCSKCGVRSATNMICYGGTGESVGLCDNCLPQSDPVTSDFINEMKAAKCGFCGGSPCSGGTDSLANLTGGSSLNRWMCFSCAPEYYATMQLELAKVPDESAAEDQLVEMKNALKRVEAHMRQYVRRRDN